MRFLTRLILPALMLAQMAFAQQETRIVYLVRHAEAASSAPDAALTPAGQKRAECLARTFKDAGIKQIFVSDAKRTQETAAPLAKELKITPTIVPAKDPSTLIRDLLYAGGGSILVVSHSNELPFVLARMHAGTVTPIGEDEYDRLFVTTVIESGATQVSTLRYCECGPVPAAPGHHATATKSGKKAPTKKKP
ncbi:MAG TPA: phosphoglycerate mutase family protein [Candidatus Acidoferrales bacterium]|jgi:phosphohistidine phosphatase SixA|nr:phosphoglycerate mutase family protein [Candidatus Acidoferrales bacterium]